LHIVTGFFVYLCEMIEIMRKVYFEIGGKKMVTTINAKTDLEAIEKVKDKIIFHKIVVEKEKSIKNIFDEIMEICK